MTTNHRSLTALDVLDSRGRPTLAVRITLGNGSTGTSGVPSGASTGTRRQHRPVLVVPPPDD